MTGRGAEVSIIIPTLACRERAASLVQAIDTVVAQQGVRGIPLVVVNGNSRAPEVLEHLRRRGDIRLFMRDEASLPAALRAGRLLVDTPYFAVLDDDDELLPGALQARLEVLGASGADLVVTNGYLAGFGRRELNIADFGRVEADPLRMLFEQHWLPPCAGLFDSARIEPEFFETIPRYREWTFLALRFALTRRIAFAARPTFLYCIDTADSLSKSRAYCLGGPPAIARMLELPLPADVRAALRARLAGDMHSASSRELEDGNYRAAWRWHWRSLAYPAGWRYAPYMRKLILGSLSSLVAACRAFLPGPM
jgi:glycosyltransferase involved in cell wall biosynthesis